MNKKRIYFLLAVFSFLLLFNKSRATTYGIIDLAPIDFTVIYSSVMADVSTSDINRFVKRDIRRVRKLVRRVMFNQHLMLKRVLRTSNIKRKDLILEDDACLGTNFTCKDYVYMFYFFKNLEDISEVIGIDPDNADRYIYEKTRKRIPSCFKSLESIEKCIADKNDVDIILYTDYYITKIDKKNIGSLQEMEITVLAYIRETNAVINGVLTIPYNEIKRFNLLESKIRKLYTEKLIETFNVSNTIDRIKKGGASSVF